MNGCFASRMTIYFVSTMPPIPWYSDETTRSSPTVNYLGVTELLSKFDAILAQRINNIKNECELALVETCDLDRIVEYFKMG